MSFAEDMISRIRQNRSMLKTPGERMRQIRQVYLNAGIIKYESDKPVHKKLTVAERQKIRRKIIRAQLKDWWKPVLSLFIAFILTAGLLYLLFFKVHLLYPYFER